MHSIDPKTFSTARTSGHVAVVACFTVLASIPGWAQEPEPHPAEASEATTTVLQEVIVSAPEPRYVAPTRRDRVGRIWAPVFINDKGPFRLVLDTGASHSGISAEVASILGLQPNQSENVLLRGVTGNRTVATVRVKSLVVGDMELKGRKLPIITDPLGGAQGILGSEGLADKRIYIDFRNDFIRINHSRNERAASGYVTIPVKFARGKLLTIDALIGTLPVKAIIDTGAEVTIANVAAQQALFGQRTKMATIDRIEGATSDVQEGLRYSTPAITIGDIQIRSERITFMNLRIFEHWKMTDEPAILIGMDALGLLDTLIIDYRRSELHMKVRG